MSSRLQQKLSAEFLSVHPTSQVKKIGADNFLDIHLPFVHEKKGTHLFFNTSGDKIKVGFYCRDEEFVQRVLADSADLEPYSQGVRLKGHPAFTKVSDAVNAAIRLVDLLNKPKRAAAPAKTEQTKSPTPPAPKAAPAQQEVEEDQDDERGYPLLIIKKSDAVPVETVQGYVRHWQQPSKQYAGRLGIPVHYPDWVEEFTTDAVCPVFTTEQMAVIEARVRQEKMIPILECAPEEMLDHVKAVWWIVPFAICRGEFVSFLFVSKDGVYGLFDSGDGPEIMSFVGWESVESMSYECPCDDGECEDPNVARLTLETEDGSLEFDEFVSPAAEQNRGSYLSILYAIWEVRRKTIEASKGQPFWIEGVGGETIELFESPSELLVKKVPVSVQVDKLVEFYNVNGLQIHQADFLVRERALLDELRSASANLDSITNESFERYEQEEIPFEIHARIASQLDSEYQGISEFKNAEQFVSHCANMEVNVRIAYICLPVALKASLPVLHYLLESVRDVFPLFPENVRKDKAFILSWMNKVKQDLREAEEAKSSDPENKGLVKVYDAANKAAGLAPHILAAVDDSLIGDEEILNAALSSKYVSFIEKLDPVTWSIDKKWAVKAAMINIHSVHYLPKSLKLDVDVCKSLLDVHLSAFNFFEEEMKRHKKVQTYALKKDGYVFQIFPDDLKCDKGFINNILDNCYDNDDQSGFMIFAMCEELKNDPELVDLAIERNANVFKELFGSSSYTREQFLHYLTVNHSIFSLAPQEWKEDPELMIAAMSGGFDSQRRSTFFKQSTWYEDRAFALKLVQSSEYPYSIGYLKDEFQCDPEILNLFFEKHTSPEAICALPVGKLGLEFCATLVDRNNEYLLFIKDRDIANTLFESHREYVLESVKLLDSKKFRSMGALDGHSDVFRAYMTNPLITRLDLEQPGYQISQDEALMAEIASLVTHYQQDFIDKRFRSPGHTDEAKENTRMRREYVQSVLGSQVAFLRLMMSDPDEVVRETAAQKIELDAAEIESIMKNGVPMVVHYEYGKSVVQRIQDNHVRKGLMSNPLRQQQAAVSKNNEAHGSKKPEKKALTQKSSSRSVKSEQGSTSKKTKVKNVEKSPADTLMDRIRNFLTRLFS
jgi:hypothetical protein